MMAFIVPFCACVVLLDRATSEIRQEAVEHEQCSGRGANTMSYMMSQRSVAAVAGGLGSAPRPASNPIMAAEPVWALRCWEAVAEEETAKVDEML
eukprot:CAMPEP_0177441156 /NCGR_PEP_ID=MMETSP0369-20130122/4260_1 /TAXON_ID=447022 ORGANISM="Scrippsiella hangoei-like, Strain SHHI-4" /NCGR_SAMPLE_ID=MMETSP0369 /ASSEMBLY_ACC=CAM_ASM_000364 /LENGTH=94 /DNA_ID=CAMNT_0018913015 /DNA_START=194 /DNA_END=474 /DNA_ORIENTATION=-